jgi:hypothetical protein
VRIKKPVNFAIGIFCGLCFVINIVNGRDMFYLCISAIAASVNIAIGLSG